MTLLPAMSIMSRVSHTTQFALKVYPVMRAYVMAWFAIAATLAYRAPVRQDLYNILWAVVFGFATLNILSLAARRYEPTRRGLTFGELMAVLVVLTSIVLLGWEMLNLFHIFPIKLSR